MIKVLNLYAGIGGNRKLWEDVEVTAIEIDPKIAKIYQDFFPNDKVIICDAHQFLLKHFKEFDFIWSSPPCPSHSHIRKELAVEARKQNEPIFLDMKLYEEILFLQGYFKGKWVVENVISWYKPLIKPFESGHHYFWSNFNIANKKVKTRGHHESIERLGKIKGFEKIRDRALLRNCVEPNIGLHVFNMAFKDKQKVLNECSSQENSQELLEAIRE